MFHDLGVRQKCDGNKKNRFFLFFMSPSQSVRIFALAEFFGENFFRHRFETTVANRSNRSIGSMNSAACHCRDFRVCNPVWLSHYKVYMNLRHWRERLSHRPSPSRACMFRLRDRSEFRIAVGSGARRAVRGAVQAAGRNSRWTGRKQKYVRQFR